MSGTLMGFVGDVLVSGDNPARVFEPVKEVLKAPDVLFGNLECAYTDQPRVVPSAHLPISAPARNLDVYADVGFNVMSLANNHIIDAGYEAMLETRARLRARGIQTCGAGENLADARMPAIVEAGALKAAFLAYASIFPRGYEARSNRPGLAPMRAHDVWRTPYPLLYAPGMRPLVTTIPDETDLAQLAEDLRRAQERADIVIVSFHWGDQMRPFHLTDHEIRTARYCIDHGAHLVVGHHHHAIRGMEWYRGKPIMYGLGHLAFDYQGSHADAEQILDPDLEEYLRQIDIAVDPNNTFALPDYYRLTIVAWASADRDGIHAIGFLPCKLAPDGSAHPLRLDTPDSDDVIRHLERCNLSQGLKSRIVAHGARRLAGFETLRVLPQ